MSSSRLTTGHGATKEIAHLDYSRRKIFVMGAASSRRTSRALCTRKSIRSGIVVGFMVYVMLCLHELRNQRLDLQVILKSDDPALMSEIENLISTHPRMTRAIRRDDLVRTQHLSPEGPGLGKSDALTRSMDNVPVQQTATTTPDSENTTPPASLPLDEIHISVKTSKKFHRQRLDVILKTWFQQAKDQTYFITDDEDGEYQMKTNGHLINSNCSSSHHRKALCCKMSVELDFFLLRDKRWFCHFDDDNYVNVDSLLSVLSQYDEQQDWYLGKPSIKAPLELPYMKPLPTEDDRKAAFWFATGGAGFCLSRSLVKKMEPLVAQGQFMSVGERIRLPDDVTIGFIIEHLLRVPLTIVDKFHSHLEPLHMLTEESLRQQISFSYSTYRGNQMNRVSVPGWELYSDPTRFLSLFCFLSRPGPTSNCPAVTVSPALS